ncbi:gliding motility protein GldB-related protein [Amniculibacterium aquaticum]|uniref:gliding motility protein GldB-related protein n=2 Tax=Amniculibacterium TaxID=2715289 RepID=UPI000F58F5D0|nr:DUF2268 domain-containing putative Zn-dependent protease [Amniculibacterium aquaticum]
MNRIEITLFLLLFSTIFYSQNKKSSLEIIDLGTKEIQILGKIEPKNFEYHKNNLIKQLYQPHENLWKGYLGDEKAWISWVEKTALSKLQTWKNNNQIIPKKIYRQLKKHSKKMFRFTGYQPQGKWYILYGPAWTDLGGLGSGEMIIDLANKQNHSNDRIIQFLPHELNHQIYNIYQPQTEFKVLKRIIDEGFATYVSHVFHQQKYTLAQELGYTQTEFEFCVKNEEKLLQVLAKYHLNKEESVARQFADRNTKIGEGFPGAIGYFIGYRIVEEYVKRYGKNSWKDLYTASPLDILNKSRILK